MEAGHYSRDFAFWQSYAERLRPPPSVASNPYIYQQEPSRAPQPGVGSMYGTMGSALAMDPVAAAATAVPPHPAAYGYEATFLAPSAANPTHASVLTGLAPPMRGAYAQPTSEKLFEMHRRLIELARLRQEVNGSLSGLEERKTLLHEHKMAAQARIVAALSARLTALTAGLDEQRLQLADYLKALDSASQVRHTRNCCAWHAGCDIVKSHVCYSAFASLSMHYIAAKDNVIA